MGREKRGAVKLPFVPLSFERWLQRRGGAADRQEWKGEKKREKEGCQYL